MEENNNAPQTVESAPTQQETEKVYTQEEVNNLLKSEKESSKAAILKELGVTDFKSAKEGLTKYLEVAEAEKTDLQKAKEIAESYKQSLEAAQKENAVIKALNEALSIGAVPETAAELAAIAAGKVNEDNDIKAVMQSLKNNAAYSGFFAVKEPPGTGSPVGNKPTTGITEGYGERLAKSRIAKGKIN